MMIFIAKTPWETLFKIRTPALAATKHVGLRVCKNYSSATTTGLAASTESNKPWTMLLHVSPDKLKIIEDILSKEMKRFIKKHSDFNETTTPSSEPPFQVGESVIVTIKELNYSTQGLSTVKDWLFLTPFVLPEEMVEVEIISNHSFYSKTKLKSIVKPSKERVQPLCKYFTTCNSCQIQHMNYSTQLAIKQQLIQNIFSLLFKIRPSDGIMQEIVGSPCEYYYRTKMTPHFNKYYGKYVTNEHSIGFNNLDGKIMDIESCPLVPPLMNESYQKLRQKIKSTLYRYPRGAALLLRRTLYPSVDYLKYPEPVFSYEQWSNAKSEDKKSALTHGTLENYPHHVLTAHRDAAFERVSNCGFYFTATSFFQVNPPLMSRAVEIIRTQLGQYPEIKYLVDLYCGVGVFAICLAKSFSRVLGIEVDIHSYTLCQTNAQINAVSNVDFIKGDVVSLFEKHQISFEASQCAVVLDPPRSGCSVHFLKHLCNYKPKLILYISCYPWTQAVDTKYLSENGYTIKLIQPLDFFPQTSHVENIVLLVSSS